MKRLFFSLLIFSCVAALWAVPTERTRLLVRLVDGTETYVTSYGDEHYSWLLTDDGEVVEPSAERPGFFHRTGRSQEEAVRMATQRRQTARRIGSQATAPLQATGSPRVAVVLVNFQDSVFTVGKTDEEVRAYFDLYCNGTRDGQRYTGHGSFGSIRDYFVEQSDSLFLPEFTIIGPITLSGGVAKYGANSGSSKDTGYTNFRREAMTLATQKYDGEWSDFDSRGRGQVDIVFFIFAGCGENTVQSNPDLIWPKETTTSMSITLDNGTTLSVACSACSPEHRRKSWAADGITVGEVAPDGIGVMCHELSHALGLPDFYDTNYKAMGMDVWSLMDYGCYVSNSLAPVGYTAYERAFMGWRPLEEISAPGPYVLDPIASATGRGLKVVNPENPDEFYVLEARLKAGWDATLSRYGRGLQITHVDYLASAWNGNRVNVDSDHQRITIIPANNDYAGIGFSEDPVAMWRGQLYPYAYTDADGAECINDSLTATSIPAATVFTAPGFMPHTFTDIRIDDEANQVHFLFDGALYDGIRSLSSRSLPAGQFYDLSGRPVGWPNRKGLYIRDGHKVALSH